ncbi:MGT family glycosyltransferase [Allocatelliglobosispora scoriae]|uniref:MGT family glycosyltransferase n=1 Tax=Allocatelliglobosispora scoriae TaxID=643052 RepID=A0A841BZK3_9ACTN|nr:macrolide family glycosyltransferase [Allocatelliglobosispora scoriae]MBB5873564.1 MGT family glycosyltransferase [Allocatelliglobosispora scoriae]
MGKHIAFFNIPALGHVFPTLAVVAELTRRGHRVSYSTIEGRRALVEPTGAALRPYRSLRPADTDPSLRVPARAGYISSTLLSFLDEAEAAFTQLEPVYRDDPPDLIVFDRMAFAGRVLGARLDVPTVQLWPMLVSNEHWSMGQALNAFDPADPVLHAYAVRLAEFLGEHCPALDPELFLSPQPDAQLAFYPRSFQYAGDLFGPGYSFVGPCLQPPPGRWHPPDDNDVLLVTLGTVYNARPDFYRACAEAFAGTRWRVVLAVGERIELSSLGRLPANVEVHRFVSQLDVLAHATAMVCHAGMGGIMEAMSFGLPVLAVPQTLEQEANALRVEQLGLGARLTSSDQLDPGTLKTAVEVMVKDPAIADGVAAMRSAVTATGGAPTAADTIERCLP